MSDCLFCKIINGEIPSYKIYEDDYTYACLDISNDGNGHILVLPKKHYANIFDCEKESLNEVMAAVQKICKHCKELGFQGVNVINNSGEEAGQTIHHLHFHILPRTDKDDFTVFDKLSSNKLSLEETQKLFQMGEK